MGAHDASRGSFSAVAPPFVPPKKTTTPVPLWAGFPPAGLVLLDAVPWPRTMVEVPARLQPVPVCRCVGPLVILRVLLTWVIVTRLVSGRCRGRKGPLRWIPQRELPIVSLRSFVRLLPLFSLNTSGRILPHSVSNCVKANTLMHLLMPLRTFWGFERGVMQIGQLL